MGTAGKRSCVAGKYQKSRQIFLAGNAMYVFNIHTYQLIVATDNERIDFSVS